MENPAKFDATHCRTGVVGLLLSLPIAMVISGCAASEASRFPVDQGWRIGWVDEIRAAASMTPGGSSGCLEAPSDSTARVATIAYSHLRSTRYRVVRIPDSLRIERGDKVAVNIEDCAKDLVRLQPTS